jgi:hypothetical protein
LNHLLYKGAGKLAPAPCNFTVLAASPDPADPPPQADTTSATLAHGTNQVGNRNVMVMLLRDGRHPTDASPNEEVGIVTRSRDNRATDL